jgi:TusA-related sulfurtransferase
VVDEVLVDAVEYDCPIPMMMLKKAIRLNPGKTIVFKMGQQRSASDLKNFFDKEGLIGNIEVKDYGTYAKIKV